MRILKKIKEIRSKKGELHFERWAIFDCKWFGFFIHRIHKADEDIHFHSHPWNFVGIQLHGRYQELSDNGLRLKREGDLSLGSKNYFNKIKRIVRGPVYSLFFVYGKEPNWYYKVNSERVHFQDYRERKNEGKLS